MIDIQKFQVVKINKKMILGSIISLSIMAIICFQNTLLYNLLNIIITFVIVVLTEMIFRAPDMYTVVEMYKQMFSVWNPWIFFDDSLYDMGLDRKDFWMLCFSIMILWVISYMQERGIKIRETLAKQNLWFRWLIYLSLIHI